MGLDFIKRVAPSFQKAWNNGREAIATKNLFTVEPQGVSRSIVVDLPTHGVPLSAGDKLIVQVNTKQLIVCREMTPIAVLGNVPDELLRQIEARGAALGTVERVNEYSGTADVVIS